MEKDIKKNTKLTLLVGILILIVIITTSTYAYYKTRIKSPGSKISIMGSNFSLNITDNSLVASNLTPIYDKNKETQGVKKEFTISIGSAGVTSACYDLYIDVTSLGENLRNKYFKYELTNGTDTYTGSFNERTDGSQILIIRNQNINTTNTSNSYTLYLWLSYSETEDQTDILSGDSTSRTFKGRILAKAVTGTCKESDTDPTTYMANLLVINGSADAVKKEVLKNGTVVFTITPKEGFNLDEITINCDGGTLEGNKLTITNINKNVTCVIQLGEDGPFKGGTLAARLLLYNTNIESRTDFSGPFSNDTTGTLFVQSSTEDAQFTEDVNGDGKGEDVYYFAGNPTNNWVKFGSWNNSSSFYRGYYTETSSAYKDYSTLNECTSASSYNYNCTEIKISSINDDMYWRIIRINEDGSVRLLYSGTSPESTNAYIGTSDFNPGLASTSSTRTVSLRYWGYMYNTYNELTNDYSSNIKNYLDTWYQNNLITNYDKYISKTAIYCNERKYTRESKVSSTNSDNVYEYYTSAALIRYNENKPVYKCSVDGDGQLFSKYDPTPNKFSVSTASGGNGQLTYPVALVTMDELLYAGMSYSSNNAFSSAQWFVMNSQNEINLPENIYWWTMTPSNMSERYGATAPDVFTIRMRSSSSIYLHNSDLTTQSTTLVRPVISLKACVKYSSGDGTPTNPYQVTIDSTCATAEN